MFALLSAVLSLLSFTTIHKTVTTTTTAPTTPICQVVYEDGSSPCLTK